MSVAVCTVLGLGLLCGALRRLVKLVEKSHVSEMMDDDGDFHSIADTFMGKPIFRKTKPDAVELEIAYILKANPHPNVVTIYRASRECIDMELLETSNKEFNRLDIERAHEHFLKHGIAYIDWKVDNFGTDKNGVTKVFDFNMSGIMNEDRAGWDFIPDDGFLLRQVCEAGAATPLEQDAATFATLFELRTKSL
jgi:hypothetical protein